MKRRAPAAFAARSSASCASTMTSGPPCRVETTAVAPFIAAAWGFFGARTSARTRAVGFSRAALTARPVLYGRRFPGPVVAAYLAR